MKKICTTEIGNKVMNNYSVKSRFIRSLLLVITCIFFINIAPHSAYAQATLCTAKGSTNITEDGKPTVTFEPKPLKIVRDIVLNMEIRLLGLSAIMYNAIRINVVDTVIGAIVLYIAIYGILFMTGMIQVKTQDFLIRLLKIGVVGELLSVTSWGFFNDYVVKFFNDATKDIIRFMTGSDGLLTNISFLSGTLAGVEPFAAIDAIISTLVSPSMFVTLLGVFMTSPYGVVMFGLLMYGIWSLVTSLMTALWVYVMSMVLRTLLLGLAPIFIPTILFQRTRHIFDGWINQLISTMIQPILLFTFFIFFVKLMEGSLENIMHTPLCFNKFPEGFRGSGLDFSFWRFMEHTAKGWQPNTTGWGLKDGFPVSLMSVLTFLIIAELAGRFNGVVLQIAAQISQAQTSMTSIQGPIAAMRGAAQSGSSSGVFGKAFGGGASTSISGLNSQNK